MFRYFRRGAALAALLLLAACGGAAPSTTQTNTPIEVTAKDLTFTPPMVTAKVGQPVTVRFDNQGALEHDWSVLNIDAAEVHVADEGASAAHDHPAGTSEVHVAAMPGEHGEITFTPEQPGRYTIVCTVTGHKEAGMMGMLTVTE